MTYLIGEFSTLLGISIHTLRYYEKEGLIIPKRNHKNVRIYTDEHKKVAEFLLQMKSTGMTLKELKKYVEMSSNRDYYGDLIELLEEHKAQI